MICQKCYSDNINVLVENRIIKKNSILTTIARIILIMLTFGLWMLVPKRTGSIKNNVVAICQDCGKKWSI